jgi:hypothetical protein
MQFEVDIAHDPVARVWITKQSDVPGLAMYDQNPEGLPDHIPSGELANKILGEANIDEYFPAGEPDVGLPGTPTLLSGLSSARSPKHWQKSGAPGFSGEI